MRCPSCNKPAPERIVGRWLCGTCGHEWDDAAPSAQDEVARVDLTALVGTPAPSNLLAIAQQVIRELDAVVNHPPFADLDSPAVERIILRALSGTPAPSGWQPIADQIRAWVTQESQLVEFSALTVDEAHVIKTNADVIAKVIALPAPPEGAPR